MSAALEEVLERWEPVIGLEVHVHLRTRSKLFCPCPVVYGSAPNHQVCPVCLALPGALPVLNGGAVELAVRMGLATGGEVQPRSVFARKNYFYPDLPKGYQISQYEEPLVLGGAVEIAVPGQGGEDGEDGGDAVRSVRLVRIHMEEDAGKSVHGEWERAGAGGGRSHMDLNRAGVPLVEIVSEPDLRSPQEASAFLRALRAILRHVGASDADMEKGQMRCDVNLSLRRRGDLELGTRTETKNLNSFRAVEAAIEAEIERQAELLEAGGSVVQATLLLDPESGRTQVMRVKENADDYRYFPDPDLIPLELEPGWIEAVRARLPELPEARRARLQHEYGLGAAEARLLTASRALVDFFEETVRARGGDAARGVANWLLRDVAAALKEREQEIEDTKLEPAALAALLRLVDEDRVTPSSARQVLETLLAEGGDPGALVRERGLEAVSDSGLLEEAADAVLAAHPEMAERYRGGETKVLNFLMGQVMKRTGGKASPQAVRAILARRLEGGG